MSLFELIHKYVFIRIIVILLRPYLRECKGKDNIPRGKGNVIFIANHNSLIDSFLLAPYLVLGTSKVVYILGDKKVWKSNLFYTLISRVAGNAILMDRNDPENISHVLTECIKKLRSGEVMLLFPEGTRGIPNNIAPFQKGIYVTAFRAKSTIVPIYLKNVHILSYKGKRFPGILKALFKISINIGSGIEYNEYSLYRNRSDDFCEYLRGKILELSHELEISSG